MTYTEAQVPADEQRKTRRRSMTQYLHAQLWPIARFDKMNKSGISSCRLTASSSWDAVHKGHPHRMWQLCVEHAHAHLCVLSLEGSLQQTAGRQGTCQSASAV